MNKKAEEIIRRLQGENEVFTIKVSGNREKQIDAFAILMNNQAFGSFEKKHKIRERIE